MNSILKMLSGINQETFSAYFQAVRTPGFQWQNHFPVMMAMSDNWKTLGNQSYSANIAADPVGAGSSAPVKSRPGTMTVTGGFGTFKTAREKDETEIEEFISLQTMAASMGSQNPEMLRQIINWMGDDISFCRTAALAEAASLSWALLSSACDLAFVTANSPYLAGINNVTYPVASWQKEDVGTNWTNAATEIITDIKNILEVGRSKGLNYRFIKMNATLFGYVQNNTQVQKYCASYIQNALNLQGVPTLEGINAMLTTYIGRPITIEVIDEVVSRETTAGTFTAETPFADNRAVFSLESRVGSLQYRPLTSRQGVIAQAESFYRIERLAYSDPDLEKTLVKFKAMPVIDTYDRNVYLKTDGAAWS